MADESEMIENTLTIAKSCILPALLEDFDARSLSNSDFSEYRVITNEQLYHLMDILYQNRNLLTDHAYDNRLILLRVNLLRVACEQIEPNPFFHSDDKILLNSLHKILFDHIPQFDEEVFIESIKIYKESMKKKIWKKQIGMIHSCPLFCEILQKFKSSVMNNDNLMFFLSVGSNLVAHYDPHYKTIGLNIYRHLLKSDIATLKELNIHSVIYNEALPLIQRCSEYKFNEYLYECLFKIVSIEDGNVLNSRWCKFDDVMSKLLTQFSFESESNLCKLLAYQIVKFCGIGNINFSLKPYNTLAKMNSTLFHDYLEQIKPQFNLPNRRVQRWIKKLMDLMIRESLKMLSNSKDCVFLLNIFHVIYITSIFTMEPPSFHSTLGDFTRKFILVQMKIVRTFKEDQDVLTSVLRFIDTIEQHQKDDEDLISSLAKIKTHDMLQIN